MKQKLITFIFIAIIIALLAIVVTGSRNKDRLAKNDSIESIDNASFINTESPDNIDESMTDILYWGTTCPYCHDTIDWIEKNKIEEKIVIIKKEVYNNQANSLELSAKAENCGLDQRSIGIPLMYTSDGQCLIGTPDITEYLETKSSSMSAVEEERAQ